MSAPIYETTAGRRLIIGSPDAGHATLRILSSFPIACFACALLTDIAYAQTANMLWADFSDWLLAAGMAGGVLACIVGIVLLVSDRLARTLASVWIALGSLLVLAIGMLNNLVHSRDAWTSVVPEGLALSAATVLVMLGTMWLASRAARRRMAVAPYAGVRP